MNAFLYEEIANTLERSIRDGVLKSGDKLPSVRASSAQRGVSPSTIFQAYYQLEAKGLIEAKPKSGYYVKFDMISQDSVSLSWLGKQDPNIKQLDTAQIIEELEALRDNKAILRLSSAYPASALLPVARLQKAIVEATRQHKDALLHYALPQGNLALRTLIGNHLLQWGNYHHPEEMLITTGCMEALNLCLRAVTQAGDIIAVDQLTYFGIAQMIENLGLKVVAIPIHDRHGMDLDFLKKALQQFPIKACLSVTNFNNPTGASLSTKDKKALVKMLCKEQIPLIEDDIYGELYFGTKRPDTCKQYDDEGWVMYCSSFSKTLAPGLRVGYCLPGRFLSAVVRQKRVHSICSATLSQFAMLHFLQKGRYAHHLRKLRLALHKQSLQYAKCIKKYFPASVRFFMPEGGMVLWLAFPENFRGYNLFSEAKQQEIGISPGEIFAVDGQFKHYIRLSFSHPFDEFIEMGLRQLGLLAEKLLAESND
ncbi:MAG: PLP-dependent aminotransferase family protein [Saprospiraceae bacterium]